MALIFDDGLCLFFSAVRFRLQAANPDDPLGLGHRSAVDVVEVGKGGQNHTKPAQPSGLLLRSCAFGSCLNIFIFILVRHVDIAPANTTTEVSLRASQIRVFEVDTSKK